MRSIFTEKNLVVVLFVLVLVVFSMAQEDSRKLEWLQNGTGSAFKSWQPENNTKVTILSNQANYTPIDSVSAK